MTQIELENEVNEEKKTLKKTKRTGKERINVLLIRGCFQCFIEAYLMNQE